MKLLHASIVAVLLFAQAPAKKLEKGQVQAGPPSYQTGEIKPLPFTLDMTGWVFCGGKGKTENLPIDKLLDEKLKPLMKAVQEHSKRTHLGDLVWTESVPLARLGLVSDNYCLHEWAILAYHRLQSYGMTNLPLDTAEVEQCTKCGLLRIKG